MSNPLQYTLRRNRLTIPPSYAAYVNAPSIYTDKIVKAIAERNPVLTEDIVLNVIDTLKDVCIDELVNGNRVTINNFLRISPSIRARIDSVDYSVTASDLVLNASIQTDMLDTVRQNITFERDSASEKQPIPLSCSASSGYQNLLYGLSTVRGNDMNFNREKTDEGVFIENTIEEGIVNAPIEYGTVTNGTIVFNVPALTEPTSKNSNEYALIIRTRYTANGTLREGKLSQALRTTRQMLNSDLDTADARIFAGFGFTEELEESKIEAAAYSVAGGNYDFYIKVSLTKSGEQDENSTLLMTVGKTDISGNINESAPITVLCSTDSQSITLPCLVSNSSGVTSNLTSLTIYVESLIALGNLVNTNYNGSMSEYVSLSNPTS